MALAVKAAEAGHRILFLTLEQLMTKLTKAQQENLLDRQGIHCGKLVWACSSKNA